MRELSVQIQLGVQVSLETHLIVRVPVIFLLKPKLYNSD